MASSFFSKVVDATKDAVLKRDTQLQKESDVVYSIVERRIKKTIMERASLGFTTAEVNLNYVGHIDIVSKYSVQDIIHKKLTAGYVPVIDRLIESKDFYDFQIGTPEDNVYVFDWTHAMVKTETPPAPKPPQAPSVPAPASTHSNAFPFYNSLDSSGVATDAEVEAMLSMLFPHVMGTLNTV